MKNMNWEREGFVVKTDRAALDVDFLCEALHATYWAKDRPRQVIEETIRNSLCFGVYEEGGGRQVGFARVVTDQVTFAWVCDVLIDPAYRGRGLGKWLMACVTEHPYVSKTMNLLGTLDAHGLYEKYGFVRSEQMKRIPSSH